MPFSRTGLPGDYRFSEDLDFTLVTETGFETIRKELDAVFVEARHSSGVVFRFGRQDKHAHANSYTFYLGMEGPLPSPAGGREVKVDITIRERIVFPLKQQAVLRGYKEYTDLPDGAKVWAYSLDEIASEKVVALTDPARNEPRDLYDLWYLVTGGHVDLGNLVEAVQQKWDFRGKKFDGAKGALLAKEARYKKLWDARLAGQIVELPEFAEVCRCVQRALRQAGFSGK